MHIYMYIRLLVFMAAVFGQPHNGRAAEARLLLAVYGPPVSAGDVSAAAADSR